MTRIRRKLIAMLAYMLLPAMNTFAHPDSTASVRPMKQWSVTEAGIWRYPPGTAITGLHNTEGAPADVHTYTCRNTPVVFFLYLSYKPDRLLWKLSQTPALSPAIDVTDARPTIIDSMQNNGVWLYKYQLVDTCKLDLTGTVPLTVSSTSGAITEDITIQVEVREAPGTGVTLAFSGCQSDTAHFTWDGSSAGPYTINKWKWTVEDTVLHGAQVARKMPDAGTVPVQLRIVSTEGCIKDTAFSVTVYAPATAAFTATADVCPLQPVTFTDQSVITQGAITRYIWDFGNGTAADNASNAAFTQKYAGAGGYTVSLITISDRGCASNAVTHIVTVHPQPQVVFDLPEAVCMPGGKAYFSNETTIAERTTLQYQWSFGDGSAVGTDVNPTHTYATTGTYQVKLKVISSAGCTDSSTQSLTRFEAQPVARFAVQPATVCQGEEQQFTDASTTSATAITEWRWNFANGNTSLQQNPAQTYTSAGTYEVQLTVVTGVGCTSEPFPMTVTVNPQPVVEAGDPIVVEEGTVVMFQATAGNTANTTFAWTPATGLSDASILRPTYTVMEDQVFTLTATASEGGCTASDDLVVQVLKNIEVPNVFTPNGDGVNDTWVIAGLSNYAGCTAQVFNRYGQIIYTSKGYRRAWDGVANGSPVPAGVYYYIIMDATSKWRRKTGSVTIIR